MSRDIVVAKRYAKALFELANEQQLVAQVEEQLAAIVQLFHDDVEVIRFLDYPGIDSAQKITVMRTALQEKLASPLLSVLELLITRRRHHLVAAVYDAYVRIAGDVAGEARAVVRTAKQMTDEEIASLSERFSKLTGKRIVSTQVVEPGLFGGVEVRIGDSLYDGSLAGKLKRLEKSLKI
ncbi:F0F1 ATP synthase subunit delta [Paenibacillus yanchengensis]|uniref:ATP synthase subunit delta n=1 Tax=Paenibacillus yanchengensis TaxID=2035833 RepID=A0ABW4YNI4_9BACL